MADQRPLTHQQVERLLADYRDLSGREKTAVAAHLATCRDCARLAAEIEQVDVLLKNTAWKRPNPQVAANFYDAVEQDGRSWFQSLSRLGSQLAGVAVLLLVVLSAWLVLRERSLQTAVATPTITAVTVTATAPAATLDPGTRLSPRYTLTETVTLFAFSPESSYLVTAENGRIYIREGGSGKQLHILAEETAPIESLAFTPNGVNLIGRDTNGQFHRWLAFNGAYQQIFNGAQSPVGTPFALGNTTLVLVTAENNLELWPLTGSRPKTTIETGGASITSVAVSPDGQAAAAVFSDGTISLWNDEGEPVSALTDAPAAVSELVLTNNGRLTATYHNNTFQLWQENSLRHQLPPEPSPASGAILDLRFISDNHFLMVGYEQGFIEIWDVNSGERIRTFYSGPAVQATIGLTRDGFLYATLDAQGMLTIWDKPKE